MTSTTEVAHSVPAGQRRRKSNGSAIATPSRWPMGPAGRECGSVATSMAIWVTTATAAVMPTSTNRARAAGLTSATPSRYPAGPRERSERQRGCDMIARC